MALPHKPWEGTSTWNRRDSKKPAYRQRTTIKFKHLMNYSITVAAIYTTLHSFMSKKNKFLTIRRNLQIDLTSQLAYQELELIVVSSR
jgi:hypothetical protein